MDLVKMKDSEILLNIKKLVQDERNLLTEILHHLRAVEARKLFSELGYRSLFEYSVKELKYSDGQAGRRIQAMRLLKDLPEVEAKIQTGALSLSHISQAQSYFREKAKTENIKVLAVSERLEVLSQLENTSTRQGEKILLSLGGGSNRYIEKEKMLSDEHSEMRFIIDCDLRNALEQVRGLLGAKGLNMTFGELIKEMCELSIDSLKIKKFGKHNRKSARCSVRDSQLARNPSAGKLFKNYDIEKYEVAKCDVVKYEVANSDAAKLGAIPSNNADKLSAAQVLPGYPLKNPIPAPEQQKAKKFISKTQRFEIWQRDQWKCTRCASRFNLNIDHIHPKGLGGSNELNNLRLLCFHCNQRRAINTYGNHTLRF